MTGAFGVTSKWQELIDRNPLPYHLTVLSIMLMIVSLVYFETFRSMVDIWLRSGTFLHGFIILPVSFYLVWQKWPQLKSILPKSNVPGIFLLLVVSTAIIISVVDDSSKRQALQTLMKDAYGAISECLGAAVPQSNCSLGRTNTENI